MPSPTTPNGNKTLLDRIGGQEALCAAVDEFYARLVADPELQPYFKGVNIRLLKWHQYNFMSIAFTEIPADMDIPELILVKHQGLFEKGLNEHHFDIVAGHFVATLKHLGVPQDLIDEAVGVIAPLRPVFVQGAAEVKARKARNRQGMAMAAAISTVVVAIVARKTSSM